MTNELFELETTNLPVLNEENYYEDTFYMSTSRFKSFMECEARQLAIENETWEKPSSVNFIVGNYVHSYFENEDVHKQFIEDNKNSIYSSRGKNKGGLKSEFITADKMIATLDAQPLFHSLYNGKDKKEGLALVIKEQIVTGVLDGIYFKGKLDSVNLTKNIFCDIKTMAAIQKRAYSERIGRSTNQLCANVLDFYYDMQMYVYSELLKQNYGEEFIPYIMAVSKENIPDVQIVRVDSDTLEFGKSAFKSYSHRLYGILNGTVEPTYCGKCDYCLTHKLVIEPINLVDLL